MAELKESAGLRGVFKMSVYKEEGGNRRLVETFEADNVIVDAARVSMARLIAGDVGGRSMQSIAFGTDGAEPDAEIANPFVKGLDGADCSEGGRARFSWSLSTSEANGLAIMKFGLLTGDGALFCRRTRAAPINKESDISLEGTWTIIF
ncbi:MAG: hypothetical protein LBL45_02830 [Treponema sp.]|jgi:hypothetical protein|nr:hypothetical protein [Treponema sp.]